VDPRAPARGRERGDIEGIETSASILMLTLRWRFFGSCCFPIHASVDGMTYTEIGGISVVIPHDEETRHDELCVRDHLAPPASFGARSWA
jgi:hypothetical protein